MSNSRIEGYERFFRLLQRDQEKEFEVYEKTPLRNLFADNSAYYGYIGGVTEYGQVILHFDTVCTPRLKVPMSICVLKGKAFECMGEDISEWTSTCLSFRENYQFHTSFSDALPLYYLSDKAVGCGALRYELYQQIKLHLSSGKKMRFVLLQTLPPLELLMNLADYIKQNSNDESLDLQPQRTYDNWHPTELKSTDNVSDTIIEKLMSEKICVLQGPPGTGKSYALASIISEMTAQGKSVCVTTQSNASLISLISQKTLQPLIERGTISKTVLSAEEQKKYPFLVPADKEMLVREGCLLCSTYYSLSRIINKTQHPICDLIVVEEASQAFLTAILAFMKLGTMCLIVGDPMQLPPVVSIGNEKDYVNIDVETQSNGMMTVVCANDYPSYRITTSYRLTKRSAEQSKFFYGGHLTSVQNQNVTFNVPLAMKPYFPDEGGTIICNTDGSSGAFCSDGALKIIHKIVDIFLNYYPKRRLAILSPFVKTADALQKVFYKECQKLDVLIDTINRIQGETVDYTIFYVPLRNYSFAFSENLFNVATSRSRSTTLLLLDMPIEIIPIQSKKVNQFLASCKNIDFSIQQDIDRDQVRSYYPGLEDIVNQLLDRDIPFSHEGDVDLCDHNGMVIASAGLLLTEQKIAVDPVDDGSRQVFEHAGYKVVSKENFNINLIK